MDHRAEGTSRYSEQIAKAAKSHISICRFEGWATEAYRISISRVHVSIASRVSVGVHVPNVYLSFFQLWCLSSVSITLWLKAHPRVALKV
jgi:hypothetical protein